MSLQSALLLKRLPWPLRLTLAQTCTYDEGHQLKNSESKKHKDLMALDVPWRLLLTGTPLQNNLTELIVRIMLSSKASY